MPSTSLTWRVNSAALSASLVALVATMRTADAPESAMIAAYSRSTPAVRARASGASRPVLSTPWPSLTISIRRATSVIWPRAGSTSPTSSRSELVPQSTAATRGS